MEEHSYPKILADCPTAELLGRSTELERLVDFALSDGDDGPLLVYGAPGAGVSELLKHAYDRVFSEQSSVIPFYFALGSSGATPEQTARRFLHQFLLQTVAFRRSDASVLNWFPDLCELAEIAIPSDGHWIDRLIHSLNHPCTAENEESVLNACFGAPVRAAAAGVSPCGVGSAARRVAPAWVWSRAASIAVRASVAVSALSRVGATGMASPSVAAPRAAH